MNIIDEGIDSKGWETKSWVFPCSCSFRSRKKVMGRFARGGGFQILPLSICKEHDSLLEKYSPKTLWENLRANAENRIIKRKII